MTTPDRQSVWLPTPVYEALPVVYVVIGLALLSGTLYIGYVGPISLIYAALGILIIGAGALLRRRRETARREQSGSRAGGIG